MQAEVKPCGALTEITSEMVGHDPIIRHHANISMDLKRGKAVQLQVSTRCQDGLMKPMISLMNFTPKLDICIEHAKNAVECFAELATRMTHDKKPYESVLEVVCILMLSTHTKTVA